MMYYTIVATVPAGQTMTLPVSGIPVQVVVPPTVAVGQTFPFTVAAPSAAAHLQGAQRERQEEAAAEKVAAQARRAAEAKAKAAARLAAALLESERNRAREGLQRSAAATTDCTDFAEGARRQLAALRAHEARKLQEEEVGELRVQREEAARVHWEKIHVECVVRELVADVERQVKADTRIEAQVSRVVRGLVVATEADALKSQREDAHRMHHVNHAVRKLVADVDRQVKADARIETQVTRVVRGLVTQVERAAKRKARIEAQVANALRALLKKVERKAKKELEADMKDIRMGTSEATVEQRRAAGQSSSRYVGVHWDKVQRQWRAQIYHEGRSQHVGLFAEEADAARAVDEATVAEAAAAKSESEESGEPETFEVRMFVGERRSAKGKTEYKVRWKGYGEADDSWEPESSLRRMGYFAQFVSQWQRAQARRVQAGKDKKPKLSFARGDAVRVRFRVGRQHQHFRGRIQKRSTQEQLAYEVLFEDGERWSVDASEIERVQ